MQKLFFWFLVIIIINVSCGNVEEKDFDGKDSCEIIMAILSSEKVKTLSSGVDSLFIIKSEVVNDSWPDAAKNPNVFYIREEKDVAIIDFSPNTFYGKRFKIAVPIFKLHRDMVNISLVIYYNQEVYQFKYKLKFTKNKWIIL